jgi:hypothetical protein
MVYINVSELVWFYETIEYLIISGGLLKNIKCDFHKPTLDDS